MRTQLKIRTEFSFRWAYGPVKKVVERLKATNCEAAAITDRSSTFGHIQWNKYCKDAGIKPLFGVELAFIRDVRVNERRQKLFWIPLIAKTNAGLREIYSAIEEATTNFYYVPRLPFIRLNGFSKDVLILSGNTGLGEGVKLGPRVYREAHPATLHTLLLGNIIPVSDNYMITTADRSAYEILAGRNKYDRPSPMHILDEWELKNEIELNKQAFMLSDRLAEECDAEIQTATNIKYRSNQTLEELCLLGAGARRIELNKVYTDRLYYELGLIKEKGYEDYFHVITDLVRYAKTKMLVGPARGSSCGSLVCYLLGITDIDPIPHGLIFERFIDVTRYDLPDIDIDFQDTKREMVFEYIREKYGAENVARLGTISRYKPKSAIGETAKALGIPDWETKGLKDSMLKRSSGDSRAGYAIMDTFTQLEVGQRFIEKYPAMKIATDLENHAHHTGMHSAGVIITNEPIAKYVAKDLRTNTVQVDKYDAELINLMKIDALGLKTLSIISDCLDSIGWPYERLLKHPLDDDKAYEVLRKNMFCGIFQYEGQALQTLARRVNINQFDDISALTALARPGPFASGAANDWVMRRAGKQPITYVHPSMERYTKDTYGIIVYQEQVMICAREIGLLSWEDVSTLRKAMSKSFGVEYFDRYWQRFKQGAISQGIEEPNARIMWDGINKFGSWAFNKSHAVAYGMMSYFCCVLKATHPIEFALATIRNTQDVSSVTRYLRELDRAGYGFKNCDPVLSEESWSFKDGAFLGGLTNIKGIGRIKAQSILLARQCGMPFKFPDPIVTPFDNIFEGRERFADLIANPRAHGILYHPRSDLIDLDDDYEGNIVFIAKLMHRNERSLNEIMFLEQRGGVKMDNDRWLNILLEDDTATVYAVISRYKYHQWGVKLINEYNIGDWFIFGGKAKQGRRVYIDKYKFIGSANGSTERSLIDGR